MSPNKRISNHNSLQSNAYSLDQNFTVLCHTADLLVVQTNNGKSLNVDRQLSEQLSCRSMFGGFNLGLHVGDNASQVLANRVSLLAVLNQYLSANNELKDTDSSQINSINWIDQVHGNQVLSFESNSIGFNKVNQNNTNRTNGLSRRGLTLAPCAADAMISDQRQNALAIMTADCVPIVLYHPVRKQIAAIHAGWKGLANGIIATTMQALDSTYHKGDIDCNTPWQAWIGACICPCCYEVSRDMTDELLQGCESFFSNHKSLINPQINQSSRSSQSIDIKSLRHQAVYPHATDKNKAWLDLVAITTAQLRYCGVEIQSPAVYGNCDYQKLPHLNHSLLNKLKHKDRHKRFIFEQYTLSCSYADDRYYSYRRITHQNRKNTGRMALIIVRL